MLSNYMKVSEMTFEQRENKNPKEMFTLSTKDNSDEGVVVTSGINSAFDLRNLFVVKSQKIVYSIKKNDIERLRLRRSLK
jgi:hypothetical protein